MRLHILQLRDPHPQPLSTKGEGSTPRVLQLLLYPIGSILPPTGIIGAVLLSVITMSYLDPSRRRHCPPTSGVLAMFFCANGGNYFPFHSTWPTMVSSLVAAIAATTALESFFSAERLSTSTATSNSACTKPIGWVHCLRVACS